MRTILKKVGGMPADITEDGDVVVSRVRQGTVDLIVMDVSLANTRAGGRRMDGLELTRIVKELEAETGRRVPVLLATAHAMRGDGEKFLEQSGADGYVTKPIVDHAAFVKTVLDLSRA
ncbi:MAG: response regulator [Acidobacteria bacterium]|nr:response regulator [Acidobacteriota bacterium]